MGRFLFEGPWGTGRWHIKVNDTHRYHSMLSAGERASAR
jgi:hypothetical protein